MPEQPATAHRPRHRHEAVLRLDGDCWTIAYDKRLLHLSDGRGLRYLDVLLRHPGRAFHVTELLALVSQPRAATRLDDGGHDVERARKAVTNRIRQTLVCIRAMHESLGLHLGNAVHTGTRCSYTPERPSGSAMTKVISGKAI